jgi:hypothetical protein
MIDGIKSSKKQYSGVLAVHVEPFLDFIVA